MGYVSGDRPARLRRIFDPRSISWTAFTLAPQTGLSIVDLLVGRHLGDVTSVRTMHEMVEEGDVAGANQRWVSVVATQKRPITGIHSLHEAMAGHLDLNTSNHEPWSGSGELLERVGKIRVRNDEVDAILRVDRGFLVAGVELSDLWLTSAIPQTLREMVVLELVPLKRG